MQSCNIHSQDLAKLRELFFHDKKSPKPAFLLIPFHWKNYVSWEQLSSPPITNNMLYKVWYLESSDYTNYWFSNCIVAGGGGGIVTFIKLLLTARQRMPGLEAMLQKPVFQLPQEQLHFDCHTKFGVVLLVWLQGLPLSVQHLSVQQLKVIQRHSVWTTGFDSWLSQI